MRRVPISTIKKAKIGRNKDVEGLQKIAGPDLVSGLTKSIALAQELILGDEFLSGSKTVGECINAGMGPSSGS
jgi:hypothetical protein